MKLRYGIDVLQLIKSGLGKIADRIIDKVLSTKKCVTDYIVSLVVSARNEACLEKRKGM